MRGYNKVENKNNEPLILEPEDWTEEEYKVLLKVFGCPENTTSIKVKYSSVEWFEEHKLKKNQSKYVMIVTSEDERYDRGETNLGFYACEPWEGLLKKVVYGNDFEELYGDGRDEGLFYQVYERKTGKRIGYGTIDPDYPREDIEEWEKEKSLNLTVKTPIGKIFAKEIPDKEFPGIALLYDNAGQPGAIMDYDPEKKSIQVRVYDAADPEGDPITVIKMSGCIENEKGEENSGNK